MSYKMRVKELKLKSELTNRSGLVTDNMTSSTPDQITGTTFKNVQVNENWEFVVSWETSWVCDATIVSNAEILWLDKWDIWMTVCWSWTSADGKRIRLHDALLLPSYVPPIINQFVFNTWTAPSIASFEATIWFTLINWVLSWDTITFDNTWYAIPWYAFYFNSNITSVLSEAISVWEQSFWSCSWITFDFPSLTTTWQQAFEYCTSATSFTAPLLSTAWQQAFALCTWTTTFDLPSLISAWDMAFALCTWTTTFDLPLLTTIWPLCFSSCSWVTTFDFPSLTTIWQQAFENCTSATSFNLPIVSNIWPSTWNDNVFQLISWNTISVNIPSLHQVSNWWLLEWDLSELSTSNTVTFNWL